MLNLSCMAAVEMCSTLDLVANIYKKKINKEYKPETPNLNIS